MRARTSVDCAAPGDGLAPPTDDDYVQWWVGSSRADREAPVGSFRISYDFANDAVHVIRVSGDVNFGAAPELKKWILDRVQAGDRRLIVDLCAASFIDSTAIGVLVGALKRLQDAGGTLAVVCATANVRTTFEVVGIEHVITMYSSSDDALAAFA
jgi:anti-sigma B factor antagonist